MLTKKQSLFFILHLTTGRSLYLYTEAGPNTDLAYPCLNSQAKVNSVSVRDGVCYVDFDSGINTRVGNADPSTSLYALVNTICETADVNKVQISVNGSSEGFFMDRIALGTVFERNLDIVRQ